MGIIVDNLSQLVLVAIIWKKLEDTELRNKRKAGKRIEEITPIL